MRQREADVPQTPPGLSFRFDGPGKIVLSRPDGFDAGAIYELVYQAKDPKVIGLGLAATRDIVSFLRHERADATGTPNALAGRIDRAIGFGVSQSGRYLHDFLYYGFNADEAGRTVFEGRCRTSRAASGPSPISASRSRAAPPTSMPTRCFPAPTFRSAIR